MKIKNLIYASIILVIMWFLDLVYGSFLLDPGLLILTGCVIVYVTVRFLYKSFGRKKFIPILSIFTLVIFYIVSIGLYFNATWLDPFVKFCDWLPLFGTAKSGFDWMINSGVLNYPWTEPTDPTIPFYVHLIAGFLYTTYPFWLYIGVRLGYILFGKTEYQTGVVGILF